MTTIVRFDRTRLQSELEALPPRLLATFAALCARRLMHAYPGSSSTRDADSQTFGELHSQLWNAVTGSAVSNVDAAEAADRALALVPTDDAADPLAEDAAAALTYALRTIATADSKNATWAAERVYNAIDTFLQDSGFDPTTEDGDEQLVRHPLVQAELHRQADDLRALRDLPGEPSPRALDALRDRADTAASSIFG